MCINKIKKTHNKYPKRLLHSKHLLKFGNFGLKSFFYKRLNSQHITLINQKLKLFLGDKKIKIWNLLFLNQQLSKLVSESRMGKGKGAIYETSTFICSGNILFEINNLPNNKIFEVRKILKKKFSLEINLIKRIIK